MNESPILFDAESVRATLAGRKTHTRRVMRPGPHWNPVGHDESVLHKGVWCKVNR